MLTDNEKKEIEEQISILEKKSQCELVPIVLKRSDDYPAASFRMAALIAFLFSLSLYLSPLKIINPIYFLWIQIPGFFCGYLLAKIPFFTRLLITKKEIDSEVSQRAIEIFFEHNLHTTKNHHGVLIFISMLEKKIKIITDIGIKEKINQKIWDDLILNFTQNIHTKNLGDALKNLISLTTPILIKSFPNNSLEKKNELENQAICE